MISVPIRYRGAQRAQFVQKLQHAIPSLVVLGDGLTHLSNEPHGIELALGVVEVAAALAVMITVVRGFKQVFKRPADAHTGHTHHGVDWIDISIGLMLFVEAYAKYHETHHIPRPTLLLGAVMIGIGMLHGKLLAWGSRRRMLRVTPEHISMPKRPFFRVTLPWANVASIDIDDRYATVIAIDGRKQRFDLKDMADPQAVRDAFMQARTALDESRHAADASIESTPTTA
jgi:hypothetical protein